MCGINLGEMKKLRKLKKDIDKGFPAFGKLLDDAVSDIPKKASGFINLAGEGFEKLFSPPFIK